jgi:hypothetical protein
MAGARTKIQEDPSPNKFQTAALIFQPQQVPDTAKCLPSVIDFQHRSIAAGAGEDQRSAAGGSREGDSPDSEETLSPPYFAPCSDHLLYTLMHVIHHRHQVSVDDIVTITSTILYIIATR